MILYYNNIINLYVYKRLLLINVYNINEIVLIVINVKMIIIIIRI